jgi:hypothetical protein
VLNPPRDRPIAWSAPSFFGAGAVLMGTHDGAVDHRVSVVRGGGQMLKNTFPDARFPPAAEATVNIFPIAETFRKVAPGNAGAIAEQHRLHEQTVIGRRDPDRAGAAG